jgi:hypothetical protein
MADADPVRRRSPGLIDPSCVVDGRWLAGTSRVEQRGDAM